MATQRKRRQTTSGGKRPWIPLRQGTINPVALELAGQVGEPFHEVWSNDEYECQVSYLGEHLERPRDGFLHLSIKHRTRRPVRDWRHFQAIKNDVVGPEREAVELYPAESRLIDGANQYHLWVFPTDTPFPLGYSYRAVTTSDEGVALASQRGIDLGTKGRQRDWQPNISTGPDYNPASVRS